MGMGNQSRKFRNLKSHVKCHFENEFHGKNLKQREENERGRAARETRAHAVGMRIGRLCYSMYTHGSALRYFETEVLKSVLNGTDMGDINHGKDFPSFSRPHVTAQVQNRLSKYFGSRLEQTVFLPPVNIQADKGTNNHRIRQFTSVVTVVPDSSNLISFVYLGQPVVSHHDGEGISCSIIGQLESWGVQSDQVEGGTFDGQYFHSSVPENLKEKFKLSNEFMCTWDPLHKGGLVDTRIREDSNFKWLVEIQSICRQIYSLFNWGKNYEELVKACEVLDIELRQLTNFQTTRFANSVRFVFINLRTDYLAVRKCMKNVIECKENSSNAEERAKAGAVKTILRNINSWVFCLCLLGCADIYDLFGVFANVCQDVDVLPYERYDKANAVITKFVKMMECIEHKHPPPPHPQMIQTIKNVYGHDTTRT